jgi:hypothetical protein
MSEVDITKEFLTPRDAAKVLKISERSVMDLLRNGKLAGFKAGKFWRVKREDLLTWQGVK